MSDAIQVERAKKALMDWLPATFGPWLAEGAAKIVLASAAARWPDDPHGLMSEVGHGPAEGVEPQ